MTNPRRTSFKALLDCAHHLADQSQAAILPHFRRQIGVENKDRDGGFDPVTAADKAAERAIARTLKRDWPEHGLVGEEYGNHGESAHYRWVVDPIDGTRAFIMGYPLWGTLIGLLAGGEPLLGLMNQPFTGERFWSGEQASYMAQAGGRRRAIKTRSCPDLAGAVLSTTHPDLFAPGEETEGFLRLKDKVRMTRYGGDCYAYCLLAAGFIDVIAEAGLKPYDIVALIPIIERAGGRVTTWDGKPATQGGRILATGDPHLHDKALKVLSRR